MKRVLTADVRFWGGSTVCNANRRPWVLIAGSGCRHTVPMLEDSKISKVIDDRSGRSEAHTTPVQFLFKRCADGGRDLVRGGGLACGR